MAPLFDSADYALKLRLHLARLNVQQREAARQAGVDKSVFCRICKHGHAPSVENYLRINRWLSATALPDNQEATDGRA